MFRKLYLSPLGILISLVLNFFAWLKQPFMVYGHFNRKQQRFYKNTRVGSTTILIDKKNIDIENNVWIGHFCILDGSGGIQLGTGVQIASHTCIYSHSSENAIRWMGEKFIETAAQNRSAYIFEKVSIGAFTFIGAGCVLLPGVQIGAGCIVGGGSVVKGVFPDYSLLVGNPAKIVADTRNIDRDLFLSGLSNKDYYDKNSDFDKV
jgi:acetyltransferase-like isoleucine patch superfamily enzyme